MKNSVIKTSIKIFVICVLSAAFSACSDKPQNQPEANELTEATDILPVNDSDVVLKESDDKSDTAVDDEDEEAGGVFCRGKDDNLITKNRAGLFVLGSKILPFDEFNQVFFGEFKGNVVLGKNDTGYDVFFNFERDGRTVIQIECDSAFKGEYYKHSPNDENICTPIRNGYMYKFLEEPGGPCAITMANLCYKRDAPMTINIFSNEYKSAEGISNDLIEKTSVKTALKSKHNACRDAYALYLAAAAGDKEKVELLLNSGVEPDIQSGLDETGKMVSQNVLTAPIIGAARNNKKEIVEILLKAGADPNVAIIEADGWESVQNDFTALTAASQTGNEYIVKLLLSAGKIKKSKGSNLALLVASCGGYKDILEELLKAGVADIDYENVLMSLSDTHHTSLTCAAEKGHKKVVETLLKFGANPNKVVLITGNDYSPSTAYSQAANEAIKDILLKAGAEPDIRKFLLIEAVTTGDKDDVKEMLRPFWKADLTARDKDGNTALDLAIKRGDTEIIEMLKEAGAKE